MEDFEVAYSVKDGFYERKFSKELNLVKDGDVLIRPKRVGICGSDVFYKNKYKGEALLLGHEWVGEVIESNSKFFLKGDKVTSCAVFGCGRCNNCLTGKENICTDNIVLGSEEIGLLRTLVLLKEDNLIKITDLDWDSAALLEVAAIGDAVIMNLKTMIVPNDTELLIIGAGAVGLMAGLAAKREGLNPTIIDTEIFRVNKGKELGIESISLGELLLKKRKFKYIADCTGDSSGKVGGWKYLSLLAGPEAKCLIVGHYENKCEFDSHLFGKFALTIKWMKGMNRDFYINSIESWKKVIAQYKDVFITEKYPISKIGIAFEKSINRNCALKTLVTINE